MLSAIWATPFWRRLHRRRLCLLAAGGRLAWLAANGARDVNVAGGGRERRNQALLYASPAASLPRGLHIAPENSAFRAALHLGDGGGSCWRRWPLRPSLAHRVKMRGA